MKKSFKSLYCALFCGALMAAIPGMADTEFEAWKKEFYQEALAKGVSRAVLDEKVPQMQLLDRVIHLDTKKPEYVSNFFDYIKTRLTNYHVVKGKEMARKYRTWLKRVEDRYGVPSVYILAFWGLETNYGHYMGKVNMLDSLATLAYHPRRRQFFTNELIAYLKMVEEEPTVAPEMGSWDGGFGNFQFMPTTFRAYAVDGDGNGRRDMIRNMPDAFSSAANYLSQVGWKKDEPWGREVVFPENIDRKDVHQNDVRTVAEWREIGIRPKHIIDFPLPEHELKAQLRMPMGMSGPLFLTYPNFNVILRWNRHELYALTIGLLADVLSDRAPLVTIPEDFRPIKTDAVIEMQKKLAEKGFYEGTPDGRIGPKTRHAIRRYQIENNLFTDGYPSSSLFENLGCCSE